MSLRPFLTIAGIAFATSALTLPWLGDPGPWVAADAWALVAVGLALSTLGASKGTPLEVGGRLLALAFVGHACALIAIDAPPWGVLQRYASWPELLSGPRGLALLGPLGQTLILIRHAGGIDRPAWLPVPALATVGAVTFAIGANLSRDTVRFGAEIATAAWILTVNAGNLALVAASLPDSWLENVSRRLAAVRGSLLENRVAIVVALWVTALSGVIAFGVLEAVPHIPDSVGYLFQAKYLSTGRLYLPSPPEAAAFEVPYVLDDGTRWFGKGSPGWPVVLAIGVAAGAPWMVNPLLGGLTVWLAHAVVSRVYGRPLAHGAALLLAASPWLLFMSASFMAHPAGALFTMLALYALIRERPTASWAALGGASLGALFLTRPLEAVAVGPVIGVWMLAYGWKRRVLVPALSFGVAGLLVAGLVLPYNHVLTGDATYFPFTKWGDENWYPGADRLGFGDDIGNVGWPHLDPFPGHGLPDVVVNMHQNLYLSSFELFGWGFGSLGFVILFAWLGRWGPGDRLFAGIVAATVLAQAFYWFSGAPDFGARYWYQALVPLAVLTARGVEAVARRVSRHGVSGPRVVAFVVAASVVAAANVLPWRSLGKYHRYRGMSADVARLADAHGFGHALVFVRAREPEDYLSAFVFNPPTLEHPGPLYVRDLGPASRRRLVARYPDREVWTLEPSATDGRFRVVERPDGTASDQDDSHSGTSDFRSRS